VSVPGFEGERQLLLRGNLHAHTTRSDGREEPAAVVRRYEQAGYDFLALSDHFEARYGWSLTEPDELVPRSLVLIRGAELTSGPEDGEDTCWVSAVGLPHDFAPPDDRVESWETVSRAREAGAHTVLLHPGFNRLPTAPDWWSDKVADLEAVEVYNHNLATTRPGYAEGARLADALLSAGHRIRLTAGDDAHGRHHADRFGGWLMVRSRARTAEAVVAALKSGAYYSTQGPTIDNLALDGATLAASCSPARAIVVTGADEHWHLTPRVFGRDVREASFDVEPFAGSYLRVTVVDEVGRRAWSNPIWLT
jgi:histidinol phosphatase-like PHP family hydrolase